MLHVKNLALPPKNLGGFSLLGHGHSTTRNRTVPMIPGTAPPQRGYTV